MTKTYEQLLESISNTVNDYRQGEIAPPLPAHVDKWAQQFDKAIRQPLLVELEYVLERTCISKQSVETFLSTVLKSEKLAGKDPCEFWKSTGILYIQGGGNSQTEMLELFDQVTKQTCGFGLRKCQASSATFLYLDDIIFTGNRVLNDLRNWIRTDAPAKTSIHIVTMAFYRGGQYYAKTKLAEAARAAGKEMTFNWWRMLELEDRKRYVNSADVLRPRGIPQDPEVVEYVTQVSTNHPLILRAVDGIGMNKLFSSERGRDLLEQAFLRAGVRIRRMRPYLNEYKRPLGNMVLKSLGVGSMIVTFRNCPNNAPLALWAGDPWYPLFPRKVNR